MNKVFVGRLGSLLKSQRKSIAPVHAVRLSCEDCIWPADCYSLILGLKCPGVVGGSVVAGKNSGFDLWVNFRGRFLALDSWGVSLNEISGVILGMAL